MERNNFIVKSGNGKNTMLDREYSELISKVTSEYDEDNYERWESYNLIISELFKIDDGKYFKEIKYRLTDGENPNIVHLDIISRYASDEITHLLWFLKGKIEEYIEEDFLKRFYQ